MNEAFALKRRKQELVRLCHKWHTTLRKAPTLLPKDTLEKWGLTIDDLTDPSTPLTSQPRGQYETLDVLTSDELEDDIDKDRDDGWLDTIEAIEISDVYREREMEEWLQYDTFSHMDLDEDRLDSPVTPRSC
ncbi:MAG: hypothetical protein ACREHG_02720 [Candidatus Saccharimonadales bacterium]